MSAHSVIVKSKEKAKRRRLDVESVAEQMPEDNECDGTCDLCCPDPMAPLSSWEVEDAKEELRRRFGPQ